MTSLIQWLLRCVKEEIIILFDYFSRKFRASWICTQNGPWITALLSKCWSPYWYVFYVCDKNGRNTIWLTYSEHLPTTVRFGSYSFMTWMFFFISQPNSKDIKRTLSLPTPLIKAMLLTRWEMKLIMQFDVMARLLSGNNYTGLRLSVPIRSSIPRPFRFSHQSRDNVLHNSSFLPSITDVSTIAKQKLHCLVPWGALRSPS